MKVKTSTLTGAALDWAVVNVEHNNKRYKYGMPCFDPKTKRVYETEGLQQIGVNFAPSTDWSQGGPIIDRIKGFEFKAWLEAQFESCCEAHIHDYEGDWIQFGPTPLIAAMRCYVASNLGEEVEVPDDLV